jgi:FixJ family two-component response regulator
MERAPVIHMVDDDAAFQTAISRLLRASGFEVRTYSNAGDFLLSRDDSTRGCILLDVRMPGPSGLDLQEALARQTDPLPIIFLTGHGDIRSSVRAIKAGAVDFLTKPVDREALLNAVKNALARDRENRAAQAELRSWRANYAALTLRERQVFEGVVAGKLNKEIAAELGTAERTVKAHRAQMMEKMRVASVAELVRVADQLRPSPARPSTPSTAS